MDIFQHVFVVVAYRLIDDAIVLIIMSNICNLQINVTIDQDENAISVWTVYQLYTTEIKSIVFLRLVCDTNV